MACTEGFLRERKSAARKDEWLTSIGVTFRVSDDDRYTDDGQKQHVDKYNQGDDAADHSPRRYDF